MAQKPLMGTIHLRGVGKTFPDDTVAVENVNLDIYEGEFVVFVGPSGYGNTTLLRMVAGLEPVSSGEIRTGGGRQVGRRHLLRLPDSPRMFGPDGEPIHGERAIDPTEAAIVKCVFTEYAAGRSPRVSTAAQQGAGCGVNLGHAVFAACLRSPGEGPARGTPRSHQVETSNNRPIWRG